MARPVAGVQHPGATRVRGEAWGPTGNASLLPTPGEALQCPLLTKLSIAAAGKGVMVSGFQEPTRSVEPKVKPQFKLVTRSTDCISCLHM